MTVRLTVSSASSALAIRSRVGRLGAMRPPSSRAIGGVVPTPPMVDLRCRQSARRAHVRNARRPRRPADRTNRRSVADAADRIHRRGVRSNVMLPTGPPVWGAYLPGARRLTSEARRSLHRPLRPPPTLSLPSHGCSRCRPQLAMCLASIHRSGPCSWVCAVSEGLGVAEP